MELTSLCGDDTMRLLEKNGLVFPFSMYRTQGSAGRACGRAGWAMAWRGAVCSPPRPHTLGGWSKALAAGEGGAVGRAPTRTVHVGHRKVWTERLFCLAWQRRSSSP